MCTLLTPRDRSGLTPRDRSGLTPRDRSGRGLVVLLAGLVMLLSACSRSDESARVPESSSQPGVVSPSDGAAPAENFASLREQSDRARSGTNPAAGSGAEEIPTPVAGAENTTTSGLGGVGRADGSNGMSSSLALVGQRQLRLRDDLTSSELIQFLALADEHMQAVRSGAAGIQSQAEAIDAMRTTATRKLEAARRLANSPAADPGEQIQGRRGELQALSHLASLGNLQSAEALEQLATEFLDSDDESLRMDSRLVLVGFAIESLRHGAADAVDQLISHVDALSDRASATDITALITLAQAREALLTYGHDDDAQQVRSIILDRFADSTDPQIAALAAQFAGSVRYDEIDQLRQQAVEGEPVDLADWRQSVLTLIDESPDLATVRYLAGSALELEVAQQPKLAQVVYEILGDRFSDRTSAIGQEALMAIAASRARAEVLGRQFDPDLPSVSGRDLSMDTYRGRVVLMPFWDTRFADSLQLLPQLRKIREAHPDQVVIVGMNLDLEGTPVADFVAESGIDFPSFRSASSATEAIANDVATRFGLVSMPFTVVLDQQGRVAALDLNGETLAETVARLLADQL